VDADQLEPGATVLLHNKNSRWVEALKEAFFIDCAACQCIINDRNFATFVCSVVGILSDEADPMVSVMKVEKAPLESYADIGGLEKQIQEIKEVRTGLRLYVVSCYYS
jgi:ATP-dependent 26S proteasome regulatory subunit